MSKTDLQKAVTDATRIIEEWTANIKKIELQIANANSRLKKSEAYRERFALDAQLGKAQAISEVAKASAERASAENDLLNLRQALRDVTLRLVETEREAENARRNLRQFEAKIIQRKRVAIAGEIDEAGRNLERLYNIYTELGGQIIGMSDAMHGVSDYESAVGGQRLRRSLPKFLWRLPAAYDELNPESLATTEARFWNLPPEHDEKSTKAA